MTAQVSEAARNAVSRYRSGRLRRGSVVAVSADFPRRARFGAGSTAFTSCDLCASRRSMGAVETGLSRATVEVFRCPIFRCVAQAAVSEVPIGLEATVIASGKRDRLAPYRAVTSTVPRERGCRPLVMFVPETGMAPCVEMRRCTTATCRCRGTPTGV